MICDEDPFRRRPRKSTARRKRQEKGVWMTENMGKLPSGHRKTENQAVGFQRRKNIPMAVQFECGRSGL